MINRYLTSVEIIFLLYKMKWTLEHMTSVLSLSFFKRKKKKWQQWVVMRTVTRSRIHTHTSGVVKEKETRREETSTRSKRIRNKKAIYVLHTPSSCCSFLSCFYIYMFYVVNMLGICIGCLDAKGKKSFDSFFLFELNEKKKIKRWINRIILLSFDLHVHVRRCPMSIAISISFFFFSLSLSLILSVFCFAPS